MRGKIILRRPTPSASIHHCNWTPTLTQFNIWHFDAIQIHVIRMSFELKLNVKFNLKHVYFATSWQRARYFPPVLPIRKSIESENKHPPSKIIHSIGANETTWKRSQLESRKCNPLNVYLTKSCQTPINPFFFSIWRGREREKNVHGIYWVRAFGAIDPGVFHFDALKVEYAWCLPRTVPVHIYLRHNAPLIQSVFLFIAMKAHPKMLPENRCMRHSERHKRNFSDYTIFW